MHWLVIAGLLYILGAIIVCFVEIRNYKRIVPPKKLRHAGIYWTICKVEVAVRTLLWPIVLFLVAFGTPPKED